MKVLEHVFYVAGYLFIGIAAGIGIAELRKSKKSSVLADSAPKARK